MPRRSAGGSSRSSGSSSSGHKGGYKCARYNTLNSVAKSKALISPNYDQNGRNPVVLVPRELAHNAATVPISIGNGGVHSLVNAKEHLNNN